MSSSGEILSFDPEKAFEINSIPDSPLSANRPPSTQLDSLDALFPLPQSNPIPLTNQFLLASRRIESFLGLESRGIHRVETHEQTSKTTLNWTEIFVLWFSINSAAQNITLASIGSNVYGLGFVDATLCSILGSLLGSVPVAYTATWGPRSGNRTLICARFTMGWWPVKLCILLNLVVLLGYAMIDAVVAGQILSAVSPNGSLTVEVGIIITAILTFLVTTFGIKIFHHYERWAWLPQSIVLLILLGAAAPKFNLSSPSTGSRTTIIGNRLSFFGVCISSAITYAPCAADFLVYCSPQITTRWKVFTATFAGLNLSYLLTYTLGTGLASGIINDPLWAAAGTGTGALIAAGYDDLGKLGKFCSVIVALGMISNMVPQVYSSGIDMQILGRYPALVPRFIWNIFGVVVFTVCGLVGRSNLSQIFTNFLALMGYWISIWITITLEETYIFRRRRKPRFEWAEWDKKEKLPMGLAALVAFVVGWAGAVVSMAQYFYVGPIARLVGVDGADQGNYVGASAAALVFPPLRYWELKRFGR